MLVPRSKSVDTLAAFYKASALSNHNLGIGNSFGLADFKLIKNANPNFFKLDEALGHRCRLIHCKVRK